MCSASADPVWIKWPSKSQSDHFHICRIICQLRYSIYDIRTFVNLIQVQFWMRMNDRHEWLNTTHTAEKNNQEIPLVNVNGVLFIRVVFLDSDRYVFDFHRQCSLQYHLLTTLHCPFLVNWQLEGWQSTSLPLPRCRWARHRTPMLPGRCEWLPTAPVYGICL